MLEFKIDSEDSPVLRVALAYDFFFENYGGFLDAAVAAGKKDLELIDEMEKVVSLSFAIADMFDMFIAKADLGEEDIGKVEVE
tara:strand:- start:4220 stop:4468 length:249 start_codon:yes stop_codon:yes gene_type:complete